MRICARKTAERYDVKKMVRDMLTVYQVAITDYEDCYTIKRIVASNDCMKLYLYNPKYKIEETLLMSLDDYTLHRLKKEDIIEMYVYDALKKRENILLARRMCIRKLCAKDYTRKEMYDFLINQDKYPLDIKDINELIDQLEDRGFINDEAYGISSNSYHTTTLRNGAGNASTAFNIIFCRVLASRRSSCLPCTTIFSNNSSPPILFLSSRKKRDLK